MMLITWSASRWEWSRPTQRKRSGGFCTMTAWSNKGERLRLSSDPACQNAIKACLHPSFTVTELCVTAAQTQKGLKCYLWYSKPSFCESCMKTASVCENKEDPHFYFMQSGPCIGPTEWLPNQKQIFSSFLASLQQKCYFVLNVGAWISAAWLPGAGYKPIRGGDPLVLAS